MADLLSTKEGIAVGISNMTSYKKHPTQDMCLAHSTATIYSALLVDRATKYWRSDHHDTIPPTKVTKRLETDR